MTLPQFSASPHGLRAALKWSSEMSNEEQACAHGDKIVLRPAESADAPTILSLITELAVFEREPDAVLMTVDMLLRDGFPEGPGATPLFHVLLACIGGSIIGMAFVFQSYSTWTGPCLYLDDLYVTPAARRKGVSRTLFKALARSALQTGCARLHWNVLKWNTPAVELYDSPGIAGERLDEWVNYRLNRGDIARVADLPPK